MKKIFLALICLTALDVLLSFQFIGVEKRFTEGNPIVAPFTNNPLVFLLAMLVVSAIDLSIAYLSLHGSWLKSQSKLFQFPIYFIACFAVRTLVGLKWLALIFT